MEMKADLSLQTKQVLSQVQMQSLNILSMSMTELREFLQNEEIENPLMEYSAEKQDIDVPVTYREYDRFYNRGARDDDSEGELYQVENGPPSVEDMVNMQLFWDRKATDNLCTGFTRA